MRMRKCVAIRNLIVLIFCFDLLHNFSSLLLQQVYRHVTLYYELLREAT